MTLSRRWFSTIFAQLGQCNGNKTKTRRSSTAKRVKEMERHKGFKKSWWRWFGFKDFSIFKNHNLYSTLDYLGGKKAGIVIWKLVAMSSSFHKNLRKGVFWNVFFTCCVSLFIFFDFNYKDVQKFFLHTQDWTCTKYKGS